MIILDWHAGDLGMSAWVDCHHCSQRPTWLYGNQPGWFAIRAGEPHWVDRATNQHWHHDCGLALVDRGEAEIRDVTAVVSEKKRMATATLTPRADQQKGERT